MKNWMRAKSGFLFCLLVMSPYVAGEPQNVLVGEWEFDLGLFVRDKMAQKEIEFTEEVNSEIYKIEDTKQPEGA